MLRPALLTLATLVAATPKPAFAHHAMGGAAPTTAWDAFASGVAHPIIGLDHLAFLVAAGVLAAAAPRRAGLWGLAAFLGAGLVGALLHLAAVGLGPVEAVVAVSALTAGAVLLVPPVRMPAIAPAGLALAFAVAGLFHGHAYAEAVGGATAVPVVAYLLTLIVVQGAFGLGVMAVARPIQAAAAGGLVPERRWAGLAAAGVGAITLVAAVLA